MLDKMPEKMRTKSLRGMKIGVAGGVSELWIGGLERLMYVEQIDIFTYQLW